MKRKIIFSVLLLILSAVAISSSLAYFGNRNIFKLSNSNTGLKLNSTTIATLTEKEKDSLIYMREEEKLARDIYIKLYEKWGIKTFSNISKSEQTHTDAIKNLLVKYNIEDPVKNDTVGVFENKNLEKLYTELLNKGSFSREEAIKVGIAIEELDIKDLKEHLVNTKNTDITFVYNNLLKGSQNHLKAFQKQQN